MRCGISALLAAIAVALLLGWAAQAAAVEAVVVAQFSPAETDIADACLLPNNHIALVLAGQGMIADYLPDGTLFQHIVREGGAAQNFRPTACSLGWDGQLYVFDEATHNVFTILPDGNIEGSFKLKLTLSPSESTAVSAVGDLHCSPQHIVWALLTDKSLMAGFNEDGEMVQRIDLEKSLPYSNAAFSESAVTADGTIYVLDYHQGAILRKAPDNRVYQRIAPFAVKGLDSAPLVQDFAVDDNHNMIVVSNTAQQQLTILTPSGNGYAAHMLSLDFPQDSRISCTYSAGKFILWTRDEPFVAVMELR